MRFLKTPSGVSLLLSLTFSLGILSIGAIILSSMFLLQTNSRNLEDTSIAYYLAEGGIEEALYHISNHHRGFEAENEKNDRGFEKKIYDGVTKPNTAVQWNISSRIDASKCDKEAYADADDQCKGTLFFGDSTTLFFSYDASTKTQFYDPTDTEPDTMTQITLSAPAGSFNQDLNMHGEDKHNSAGNRIVASFLAEHDDAKLFPQHKGSGRIGQRLDGDVYKEGSADDCSNQTNLDGFYICQAELADSNENPLQFTIGQITGFEDNDKNEDKNLSSEFFNGIKTNRKLKFFYVHLVPGFIFETDPPLNPIHYTIQMKDPDIMTATKTIIEATGRSKNIISSLKLTLDNTKEIIFLDYAALLE